MIEHPDGTKTPVIDASVHIFSRSNKDLRSFLREPFKSRGREPSQALGRPGAGGALVSWA